MTMDNPYAPPQHDELELAGTSSAARGARLLGNVLICDKGAALPPLCLYSGAPVSEPQIRRTLSWAPQWCLLLAAFSPLLGVPVYFIMKKSGQLSYSLSPEAKRRRRDGVLIAFAGGLGCVALAVVAAAADAPWLVLLAVLGCLVSIVVGSVRARLFNLTKIDKQRVHLKLREEAAAAFGRRLREHV